MATIQLTECFMVFWLLFQVSGEAASTDVEQEKLRQNILTLTSERDTAHLTAQQNFQACQDLQRELGNAQDRAVKLEREVSL